MMAISIGIAISVLLLFWLVVLIVGPVIVDSNEVVIIEKKFSTKSLGNGQLIALNGEAGYQADVLRAGLHFRCRLIYRIHKCDLITIKQGKIGYAFARSGEALNIDQTLGRAVECNTFQDTAQFLKNGGQKGPQRIILREGTYAFNLAQFIIITEDGTHFIPIGDKNEMKNIEDMKSAIEEREGFEPITIDSHDDTIGVIVTFEGKALPQDDIIAPVVGNDSDSEETYHNAFQNIEAFLKAGGYKGRQLQVLTEGTYFVNRLFATVEFARKTIIDVSFVGVVNSFVGKKSADLSGTEFTHGELVEAGCKGIWKTPLSPGKYPLNPYALEVIKVPVDNFALKWVSNQAGQYNYDEKLRELSAITKDGFQPLLPLSVVVHINYLEAPLMIQRFGSVKKLVEQTLDTIISAHFKEVAEGKTFLEIVQNKAEISKEVKAKMGIEFRRFNLQLEDVLIDTPKSNGDVRIESLIEQLATRQLSEEKVVTYSAKMKAAAKERELKETEAVAAKQTELTSSKVDIEIKDNNAEANRRVAERDREVAKIKTDTAAYATLKTAETEATKVKVLAEAEANRMELTSKAEAVKITAIADSRAHEEEVVGKAVAEASRQKVEAYGGAEMLVQKEVMMAFADAIRSGNVALVPQNYISGGEQGNGNTPNAFEQFMKMLSVEKLDSMSKDSEKEVLKEQNAGIGLVEDTKQIDVE